MVNETEAFITQQRRQFVNYNIGTAEKHLYDRGLNVTVIRNNIESSLKKQRTSKISKELEEAKRAKASIKPPEDPKKDKEKKDAEKVNPNGKYKDAPYHHPNSRGGKSPAPKNGQKALDNSIRCQKSTNRPNMSTRRIGVSEGEIVILDETCPGQYHGHVRRWDELEEFMQRSLERAGLVKNGKII
jgi:hypothetical protein